MPEVWLLGSPSFARHNVAQDRGFPDAAAMHQALQEVWDATVQPGELVYVIGDLGPGPEEFELWARRRPGRRVRVFDGNRDVYSDAFWADVVEGVALEVAGMWGEQKFLLGNTFETGVRLTYDGSEDSATSIDISCWQGEFKVLPLTMIAKYWSHLKEGSISQEG